MAIEKELDTDIGVNFKYWKLNRLVLFHGERMCSIEIRGHLNRDAFIANPDKYIVKQFNLSDSEGDLAYSDRFSPLVLVTNVVSPQRQAYLYLKTLPEFEGYQDVDVN